MANETARTLRKRLTPQEVKVWVKLRELKILGFHFRRQTLIGPYIVDFVSLGGRIVIEIDGGQHALWKAFARIRSATVSSVKRLSCLTPLESDVDQNLGGVMEDILGRLNTPTPTG